MKLYQVKGIKVFNNREFAKKHQLAPGLDVISDEEVNILVTDYIQRMINQMNSHLKTLNGDQLADYVDAITETYTQTNISELILADPRMDLNELTAKINHWGHEHHVEEQSELLGISGLLASAGEMAVALDHKDQTSLSLALGKVTMAISNIALRNKLTLNECLATTYAEIMSDDQIETEKEKEKNAQIENNELDAKLKQVSKLATQLMAAEDVEVKKNLAIELKDTIKQCMDELSLNDQEMKLLKGQLKMTESMLVGFGVEDKQNNKPAPETPDDPAQHHGFAKRKHLNISNNPNPPIEQYHPSTEKNK